MLNVNPNRMEMAKLKKRLVTAVRGHKLLKDKQDELIRRFVDLVRYNDKLRKSVEEELTNAYMSVILARAVQQPEFMEEAVMLPTEKLSLAITTSNIMSVVVPKMELQRERLSSGAGIFPYGFFSTSDETDRGLQAVFDILPRLLELAEVEKTCDLMTDEIEKTRRRVNALEYMTIPQLKETIKFIKVKLDDNERSNLVRLMKVKSMMVES